MPSAAALARRGRPLTSAAMEKRVVFQSRWLPYALIAPQLVDHAGVLLLAGGAGALPVAADPGRVRRRADAVRLVRQFPRAVPRSALPRVVQVTAVFSLLVAVHRPRRSRCCSPCSPIASSAARRVYKTLLIWPYAVAPAIAGGAVAVPVQPDARHRRALAARLGIDWNPLLNGDAGAGRWSSIAAVWKQISYNFLFFLAGLQSIPKSLIEAAAIDGAGPVAALL